MKLLIDHKIVETQVGKTILEAALDSGIYIPHLCKHPDLEAAGGCRLCVVEIEGQEGAVPACETLAEDGMVVSTRTERIDEIRRTSMELMLASHPSECTDCPKYGNCELQSLYQYFNASAEKWRMKSRPAAEDARNPLIRHLFIRCIRCGRCVRACGSLRGVKALDYRKNKLDVRIGTQGGVTLAEADCRFCGACAEVCPTGAIVDAVGALDPNLPRAKALVPCRTACPGGVDIPAFLRYIRQENWADAAAVIRESVPFPVALGSVCAHPCESKCRRGDVNEPISICRLKRIAAELAGDSWKPRRRKEPATGHRVAILGAGPAGLTAAYYLTMKGHEVTVFEANPVAGGQMRVGIPEYRLPAGLLEPEIQTILEGGVKLYTGRRIKEPAALLKEGYRAVLVAVGTHRGSKLPLPGNELPGVLVNTDFLRGARLGPAPAVGSRVVVLGGGNVALDCARTAFRLGAERVAVACLESRDAMTASPEELEEAIQEGVELHNQVTFLSIEGETRVTGVQVQEVAGFHFDDNRRAVIEPREGTEHILEADTVIFAVGQTPEDTREMGLPLVKGSYLVADENGATPVEGIFAAGDVVTGTKTVIEAIAAGRKTAAAIDCWLGGDGDVTEQLCSHERPSSYIGRIDGFANACRANPQLRDGRSRRCDFRPVEAELPEDTAVCEAGRCLQCDLRLQLGRNKFWNEYQGKSEEDAV